MDTSVPHTIERTDFMYGFIDLTGQRFGKLVVIERVENHKGRTSWLCKCDCGNTKIVRSLELRRSDTISCGCYRKEKPSVFYDLTGNRYGRLTVLERVNNIGSQAAWLCKCDCGNTKIVRSRDLRNGIVKSCGCLRKELAKNRASKHYGSGTHLYAVWNMMRQRCNNPNNKDYKHYGNRGITVCSEWNDFPNFQSWALSNGYEEGLTIDRINNDGNYEPDNCRWIPIEEQQHNRRPRGVIDETGS